MGGDVGKSTERVLPSPESCHMKKHFFSFAAVLPLALISASLCACGAGDVGDFDADQADAIEEDVDLGQLEQGVMNCANPDGTNAAMAALAVATAQELKRWQPGKDFMVFGTSGQSEASPGPQQAIKLTPTGKARCADGKCWNTQALLDMQYEQANDKVRFGNVVLSPGALRSRLVAKLREQQTCDSRPANGGNNCPVEEHQLSFQRSAQGNCDTNFFFKATQPNGAPLRFPAQLKNKLQWVDTQNPYVSFQSAGDVVSIDPTYGLNEAGSTSSGACSASCVRLSRSNLAGQCCSCNGATKKLVKAGWSAFTYLCF
jgi:hypothetical protein